MDKAGPVMMTTADYMLCFSKLYRDRWRSHNVEPNVFIDVGYLYDSSFPIIKERAKKKREELQKAGADFIIGYFDENVQKSKYGLTRKEDHCREVESLLKLLINDPQIGLVIKTQFIRNGPNYCQRLKIFGNAH